MDEMKIPEDLQNLYEMARTDSEPYAPSMITGLIKRIARAEAQVAELEAQLKALDWTPITAENLPKKGDILAKFRKTKTGKPMGWCFTLDYWDNFNALRLRGWTHFRPNNPPQAGGIHV